MKDEQSKVNILNINKYTYVSAITFQGVWGSDAHELKFDSILNWELFIFNQNYST